MTLSAEWRALQRESQLAAEQIAAGVTVLGRANHAQTGLYSQAFFSLSIGLERTGKLIFIADHAIQQEGRFPSNVDLRTLGHDIQKLLDRCETIGQTLDSNRPYASRPASQTHRAIEATLSAFAATSRYYNLDYITRAATVARDPIAAWWENIARPICEQHYSNRHRARDARRAAFATAAFGADTTVLLHREDGTAMNNVYSAVESAGATAVVQKYGRLYTLQIVRWLASILFELAHRGAYEKQIEPLLGLNEPFTLFYNDDRMLRDRRTWSIFRL